VKVEKPRVGTGVEPTLTKKPTSTMPPAETGDIPSPAARSYEARARERAATKKGASSLKGKAPPLGHVESPASDKMEAIANHVTGGMARPKFIGVPEDQDGPPPEAPSPKAAPPEQRPHVGGIGSAYQVNQTLAATKTTRPLSMGEAKKMTESNFSPETVQALSMANKDLEEQASQPPPEDTKPPSAEEKKSVAQEASEDIEHATRDFEPELPMDLGLISDIRQGMMSKERREEIEKRLGELDITDMIMKREIQQTIPVIPGKFEITLRTFTQRENIWVLQYMYDFPGSQLYTQELLNTCRLVCGLVAVNGQLLPDHRQDVGTASEKIIKEDFDKKLFHVSSFPVQLVADLSMQSIWFQDRVDKLFTLDTIKNG